METVYKDGKPYKQTNNVLEFVPFINSDMNVLTTKEGVISVYPTDGDDVFFKFTSVKLNKDKSTVVYTKKYKHTENLDVIFNTSNGVSLQALNIPQELRYIAVGSINDNISIDEVYFSYDSLDELKGVAELLEVELLPDGVARPSTDNKIPMFPHLIDSNNPEHNPFKSMLIGSFVMDGAEITNIKIYLF